MDEVGFDSRDMLRRHGYGLVGKKLIFRGEFNRKPRVSLQCFIGMDGLLDVHSTVGLIKAVFALSKVFFVNLRIRVLNDQKNCFISSRNEVPLDKILS